MNTIFAEFEEFFRKGLQTIKERKGRLDIELGREILGEVNKTVALESIEGKAKTAEALGQFMMACEAAQSELTRMRGISYSLALKHSDVIGIDVTPANFSTHVGKKNYDTALENIKGYLLIGASVALAAGIGYLVFKLLSAKKERPSKGKEVVAVAKEMNKANELFSSIDLSMLPKEIQDKFQQKAFQDSHIQIQRIANYDQYIRQGYELEVANQLTIREARVLDDICLHADGGSWVVECYNRHWDKVLENIKTFIEITEKMGEVEDDILGIDLNVLEGRVDAARYSRHLDYNHCALSSGYIGNANPLFEDWAEWLTSESLMDLAPQLAAVKKGVVTPSSGEYEKFNSSKEKMGKLGDRFEKASKKLQDTFDSDLINNLVAKLKFDLEELEMMRNMVKQESKAIAESFRTKITAAKIYSARINEFLDELIDEDMKKQIQEQLKKAITALPKRVMVTEGIRDNDVDHLFEDYGMGLEALSGKQYLGMAAGLAAVGIIGFAVYRATNGTKTVGTKLDQVLDGLEKELEKEEKKSEVEIIEDRSSSSEPKVTKLKIRTLDDLADATHRACDVAKASGRDVLVSVMGTESIDSRTGKVNWEFKNEDMVALIGEDRLSSMSFMEAGLAINPEAAYRLIVMKTPATLPDLAGDHLKRSLRDLQSIKEIFSEANSIEVNDFFSAFRMVSGVVTKAGSRSISQLISIGAALDTLDGNGMAVAALKDLREYIEAGRKGDNDLSEISEKMQGFKSAVKELYADQVYSRDSNLKEVLSALGGKRIDFRKSITEIKDLNKTYSGVSKEIISLVNRHESILDDMGKDKGFEEKYDEALKIVREEQEKSPEGISAAEKILRASKIVRVLPDIVALSLLMVAANTANYGKLATAVIGAVRIQRRMMKKIIDAAGSVTMASEALEDPVIIDDDLFTDQHPMMTYFNKIAVESVTGDGVSLIEHEEGDDFLDTPDHEQAGYRFDLREGVDGANLMAMESWSLGAKVALGIGAAVAVLGIGALIASTVIKRGSTVKDRHATPETTEKLIENIEQLDSQSMKVVQRIQELQSKFNSSKQKSEYPQVDSELRDLLRKANRIQNRTVERNGQEMDQMSAIIEELGDDTTLQLQRLLAIGLASPHRSYFEVLGDQGWSGAVMSVYENVVSKATHEIDIGRDSSAILEDILNWWESSEGKHAKYRLQGVMSDPETVRGLIDNHWGFDVGESGFRASHRTSVLNALTLVVKAQDGLVKTHGRVVESLNRYTLPEKTIEKFKKLEENSRGNRDASASVVRRIEEFKPYFALYTRMARHETEVIDSILGFADRFLKAYAKIGKRDMDDVRQLSMEVSKYEAEAWAK